MSALSTRMTHDMPCVENIYMPKSARAVNSVIETISAVARETGNSSNYSDPMDFIVGEGLGIKYREYCQKFYYNNGRPLHKILSKKELAMLDTTLAKHVISVFSPNSNTSGLSKLRLLRVRLHSADQYRD